ncbi:cupin domain-containing protein [Dongia sp.]|uniref:cupin domain-containing protein n=1 Tax=Dongia sp. TaxID=1977262 RepID=UPI0035B2EAD0
MACKILICADKPWRLAPACRRPHSHTDNKEILYVLEGPLRHSVGDETRDLKPGERMYTAKGSVHAFSNPHEVTAKALVILTPRHRCPIFPRHRRSGKRPRRPQPRPHGGSDDALWAGAGQAVGKMNKRERSTRRRRDRAVPQFVVPGPCRRMPTCDCSP